MSHPMYTHYGLFYSKIPALQDKKYGKITQFLRKNLSRKNTSETKKKRGFLSRKLRFLSGAPAAVNHCLSGKRE